MPPPLVSFLIRGARRPARMPHPRAEREGKAEGRSATPWPRRRQALRGAGATATASYVPANAAHGPARMPRPRAMREGKAGGRPGPPTRRTREWSVGAKPGDGSQRLGRAGGRRLGPQTRRQPHQMSLQTRCAGPKPRGNPQRLGHAGGRRLTPQARRPPCQMPLQMRRTGPPVRISPASRHNGRCTPSRRPRFPWSRPRQR